MKKYIKSNDDLSIGFHRGTTYEWDLAAIKMTEGNYQVKKYLKDVFSFTEHQKNATCGIGFKLTLQSKTEGKLYCDEPGAGVTDAARRTANKL